MRNDSLQGINIEEVTLNLMPFWFFRTVEQFVAPSADVKEIQVALEQWTKVQSFKKRLQHGKPRRGQPPLFYKEFADTGHFREVLRQDLSLWLAAPERPWS